MRILEKKQRIRVYLQDALLCAIFIAILLLPADMPDWRLICLGVVGGLTTALTAQIFYRRYRPDRLLCVTLLCCFFAAFILQIAKFRIFPEYYFCDADSVQKIMVTGDAGILGISYLNTARFCNLLKSFFPMESQLFGGLLFFFCSVPLCVWTLSKSELLMVSGWRRIAAIGLLASYAVLLPVFVWNTQKEAVQFLILALIAAIFGQAEKNPRAMILCYTLLMAAWSIAFRKYYLLILAGSLILYLSLKIPNRKKRALLLEALCLLTIIGLLVLRQIRPGLLAELFESRASVLEGNSAFRTVNTAIADFVPNPNRLVLFYLLNYSINAVRMMIPLELISKGVLQLCFVAWQFFITLCLGRILVCCWRAPASDSNKLSVAFLAAWYIVSFLFEPDFGSFVRHQAALFPIACPLFMQSPMEPISTKT